MKNLILAKIELLNDQIAYAVARKMEIADYYNGKVDGFACVFRHFGEPDFKDQIAFGLKTIEDILKDNKDIIGESRRNFEGTAAALREVLKMVA